MTPIAKFAADVLMNELMKMRAQGVDPSDLVGGAGAALRRAVEKWGDPPAQPLDRYVPRAGEE